MNKRVRTIYPPEFKRRAVARAKSGDRSVRQLENELGLSANLLRQWVQQYDKYGERAWIRPASADTLSADTLSADTLSADTLSADTLSAGAPSAETVSEPSPAAGAGKTHAKERELRAQLDALLRLNQRLQQDNEILKKALTIFTQEPQ